MGDRRGREREIPGAGNRTMGGKIPWKTDKPGRGSPRFTMGEPNPNSPDFIRGGSMRSVPCFAGGGYRFIF